MRFRKRIQICKGVKLNLSTSGISATVGGRGLSFNLGKGGVFMNTSIPGTGLYDRKKLFGPDKKKSSSKKRTAPEQDIALPAFSLVMDEDGSVNVMDDRSGEEITSSATLRKIKATDEYKDELSDLMRQYKEHLDAQNAAVTDVHRCLEPLRDDFEDDPKYISPAYIEGCMDSWLENLQLPVEFSMDYEYNSEMQCMMADLDLPEIEDLPAVKASEMADGSVKARPKSLKDQRADYVKCVFSLALFFAGNIFNVSPHIEQVIVSGYTQRRNRAGDLEDQYLYSVAFTRDGFENVDFSGIDALDFCMNFKNRCNIAPTGEMKTITPYQ